MKNNEIDKLSDILSVHQMHAKVFFSGNLCELSEFDEPSGLKGHLHILRDGLLSIIGQDGVKKEVKPPCLLFFPQGRSHRLIPDPSVGANLVCATIEYSNVQQHPVLAALPSFVSFSLDNMAHHRLAYTADWIFAEAFEVTNGKQVMLDKLCDIFILQILRSVIESGDQFFVKQGMLAGLAHPQLCLALQAIHKNVEHPWQVVSLANIALMSRAKFAKLFVEVVGHTPLDYVTDWRIHKAQNLLLQHLSVNIVANKVGYDSGSALARVFKKKLGISPKQWLQNQL